MFSNWKQTVVSKDNALKDKNIMPQLLKKNE